MFYSDWDNQPKHGNLGCTEENEGIAGLKPLYLTKEENIALNSFIQSYPQKLYGDMIDVADKVSKNL